METGIGRGLMEIATGILGIALIALLINRSSDTAKVIQAGTGGFDMLIRTVTLQNSGGVGSRY